MIMENGMTWEIPLPGDEWIDNSELSEATKKLYKKYRKEIIAQIKKVPGLVSTIKNSTSDGKIYRVLASKKNIGLLEQGKDGLVKPLLRERGKIVEHINLTAASPDVAGAIATVALQAALTEISTKLDGISESVDHIADLIKQSTVGELKGAIAALETALSLRDESSRKSQINVSCGNLMQALGKVSGQLKANIIKMEPAETDIFTGWFGNGIEKATRAWKNAKSDFQIITEGVSKVIEAYWSVDEFDAAYKAFNQICSFLNDADIKTAIDRSRLLPYKKDEAPESPFEKFLENIPSISQKLLELAHGDDPELLERYAFRFVHTRRFLDSFGIRLG